jgi:hypothetical protein
MSRDEVEEEDDDDEGVGGIDIHAGVKMKRYDHYLLNAKPQDILMSLSPSPCSNLKAAASDTLETISSSNVGVGESISGEGRSRVEYGPGSKACKFLAVGFMGWEFCHEGLTHQMLIFQVMVPHSRFSFMIFSLCMYICVFFFLASCC